MDTQRAFLGLPVKADSLSSLPSEGVALERQQDLLSNLIDQAHQLALRDKTWSSPETPEKLQAEFSRIADEIEVRLRANGLPGTAADSIDAVLRMRQLAETYFRPYRFYSGVTPYPLTQQYGEIDSERLRVTHDGLMRIAALIAQLRLETLLAGATIETPSLIVKLVDNAISAYLAAGDLEKAISMANKFENYPVCRSVVLHLKERCLLDKGDIESARTMTERGQENTHTLRAVVMRDEWSLMEGLAWSVLARDPPRTGHFEIVRPSGSLEGFSHSIPAMDIRFADHTALSVIGGEMIVGRSGAVLRPERLHHPVQYPRPGINILNHGERGVRLHNVALQAIEHPVVILENFDALILNNYYHWTVLLLPRIHAIKSSGMLNERKLVVPAGLKDWMEQGLRLAGIEKTDLLEISSGNGYAFSNARIVSTVEFASKALLLPMRNRFLDSISQTPNRSRYLYLSRRGHNRRPLVNEDKVEELAERLGFEVVTPETLSIAQQVEMFAQASGIAATEGAALANTLFSPPGTRILSILNGNDLFPTFNDMAIVLDHAHRKLAGTPERNADGFNFLWSRYSVDMSMAEYHLKWAMGAAEDAMMPARHSRSGTPARPAPSERDQP